MKIEIEIPDWCDERAIRIMAGIELVAYKMPFEKWKIKVSRCNMCGKCCMTSNIPYPLVDGKCIHLKKRPGNNDRWECFLRIQRPFGCCVATPQNIPECTVKYEEI
jgi:hypothetical protein